MKTDWIKDRTILLTMAGSRSYGTSRPDSDVDVKGVCVTPRAYRDGFLNNFAQVDSPEHLGAFIPLLTGESREVADKDGLDGAVYELTKFFKLAADCNPNIVESLFVDDADVILCTPEGRMLRDARMSFLSKKVLYTFRGYAVSQLKRIKGHRRWLLDPPKGAPVRADYGLPERTVIPADQLAAARSTIQKKVNSWAIDFGDVDKSLKVNILEQVEHWMVEMQIGADEQFLAASRLLGYSENFIALLDKERSYKAAQFQWKQYRDWVKSRNPKRAALEAKFGYDTKHGMHLVRLLRMCQEILVDHQLHTRRPDAAELLAIRDGEWDYDRLIGWAETQDAALMEISKTSMLPHSPPRKALDRLCQEIHARMDFNG